MRKEHFFVIIIAILVFATYVNYFSPWETAKCDPKTRICKIYRFESKLEEKGKLRRVIDVSKTSGVCRFADAQRPGFKALSFTPPFVKEYDYYAPVFDSNSPSRVVIDVPVVDKYEVEKFCEDYAEGKEVSIDSVYLVFDNIEKMSNRKK